MPTLGDLLATKGHRIHSIHPHATVLEATHKMNQESIGALIVIDQDQVLGIFTERDVLRRVVGEGRRPEDVTVGVVMSAELICCPPETDVEEASEVMRNRRVRHLPVCDSKGLHGIISIGDLNAYYSGHQEQKINYLQDYIYGRV